MAVSVNPNSLHGNAVGVTGVFEDDKGYGAKIHRVLVLSSEEDAALADIFYYLADDDVPDAFNGPHNGRLFVHPEKKQALRNIRKAAYGY